jgi:murein endopeptidase
MCGGPLSWWIEEMEKDKEQQEQNTPATTPEEKEECD